MTNRIRILRHQNDKLCLHSRSQSAHIEITTRNRWLTISHAARNPKRRRGTLWVAAALQSAMTDTANFAVTPPQDELDLLARSLRFHAADSGVAETLSAEQVERFNRDGYLAPFRVFDDDEIAERC